MVIDLKLCRFEDAPWGFRLIGGADFELPLTVVKVTEGSIADKAGMRIGDVIVRINDIPACDLSHSDAQKVIVHCGNNFFLGVMRENENETELETSEENTHTIIYTPASGYEQSDKSPISDISERHSAEILQDNEISPCPQTTLEEKVTDDEIAEIMSGEAEVLKEHNVIGVNFNRILPKTSICQSSEVFRQLNEEATKTKSEKEQDKRKWTTFLQKPNRPIPRSKQELEEEAKRQRQYRVKIVKQPEPKVAPGHIPTPSPEPVPEVIIQQEPQEIPIYIQSGETENQNTTTNIVTEIQSEEEKLLTDEIENKEQESYILVSVSDALNENTTHETEQQYIEPAINLEPKGECIQKTEEELLLQKQLADVQKQLLALSTLPSTIQATLDAVTKQLAELLPSFRLQPSPNPESKPIEKSENTESLVAINEDDVHYETTREEEQSVEATKEVVNESSTCIEDGANSQTQQEQQIEETIDIQKSKEAALEEEIRKKEFEEEQRLHEELVYKKKKEHLEEEHQQRLIRERTPKRPPKAFGPLTPQERPLILPGGRRWRKPKDAYNDEFIAEILSSQAELIVGTTLGVNFLKYQKPEKHIDLEKSEVYKVIHHLERKPRRGIEARPEKVLAEADVRSRATPISCS